ncbi:hypothetical protein [Sinomicrobium sp. M5D2P9]
MNLAKNSAVSLSVFYPRIGWYDLIVNGIYPLIEKGTIPSFFSLQLMDTRGDHVQLFVIGQKENILKIVTEISKHLECFLGQNRINGSSGSIAKEDVFCDFEPNKIYYGVYDKEVRSLREVKADRAISKLLISVFKEYKEDTLEYAVELTMIFCFLIMKRLELDRSQVVSFMEFLLIDQERKYTSVAIDKLEKINNDNFKNNRKAIAILLKDSTSKANTIREQLHDIVAINLEWLKEDTNEHLRMLLYNINNAFGFKERFTAYYLLAKCMEMEESLI